MGIQSYGNYNSDYADVLNYDMYSIDKLFDIKNYYKYMGNNLLTDLKPLDYNLEQYTIKLILYYLNFLKT